VAELWHRDVAGTYQELLVPLRPEASDYEARWSDLLAMLAQFERRSPEAVAEAMLYSGADVAGA
jgi:hypothetical protein